MDAFHFYFLLSYSYSYFTLAQIKNDYTENISFREKRMHIQIDDACIIKNMERVAGIEPASLAWKARGYSRRWLIIFNVSNSKPNMKFWFHSAPLWKVHVFPEKK